MESAAKGVAAAPSQRKKETGELATQKTAIAVSVEITAVEKSFCA